jgi:predicted nucleotidyltransferase
MYKFDWEKDYTGNILWLRNRTVFLTVHGSHAYGLNTPASDVDIKGICIPPLRYFTGFVNRFEQAESKNPDLVIYSLQKFIQLACDCNPNIIELLWVDDDSIIICKEIGKELREQRQHFLSKKARHTFSGYAIAQLKRIKTHKKWLLNPVEIKPTRHEFGLPETTVLAKDQLGAIESVINSGGSTSEFSDNVMEIYQKERSYHNKLIEYQQYQNWKKNRNPARAEMEKKFLYDTKHAMHLVRLLRMCREILTTGEVLVKRPDRDELLAIRNGAWKYDELLEWAEKQDQEMEELYKTSTLPHGPDRNYLDKLCSLWTLNITLDSTV